MKAQGRKTAERLGLIAAAMIAAAFIVSFVHGLRLPIGSAPPVAATLPERVAPDPGVSGRVQVLNASRVPGAARAATGLLRESGFDVVEFGTLTLPEPADSSSVIDRTGDPSVALAVAARLGIARLVTEPDSSLFVDATVILGKDWSAGRGR